MLVQRDNIKAFFFSVAVFINVIVVVVSSFLTVKKLIRDREERVVLEDLVFQYPPIGPLGEIADFQGKLRCR